MRENVISRYLVDEAVKIHRELGPGLLETVYEVILAHRLREKGLRLERQVAVGIRYQNMCFDEGFRAGLMVERQVILELKSVESLGRVHKKQVLTYLRLTDLRLGLLLNFGAEVMREGIVRIVNRLPENDS